MQKIIDLGLRSTQFYSRPFKSMGVGVLRRLDFNVAYSLKIISSDFCSAAIVILWG